MSHYSFPLLKSLEIRQTLGELNIPVSDDDLANPAGWKVKQIYVELISLLLNESNEDFAQISFNALEHLEFPELHEESVITMSFFKACHKLLSTSGISDFSLIDVTKPDAKKLRRNLSAVINFAKFREDRQPGYVQFVQETETLAETKSELEQQNERLVTEVAEANTKRQAEAEATAALTAENQGREVVVRDLFNEQTELHNKCSEVKNQLTSVKDGNWETNLKLQEAKEQCETLKAQIVPDPRKLKHDLAALQDAEAQEKATIRSLELKLAQHAKQREALEKVEREVDEVTGLQAEVEGEQAKLKEVQKQLKENAERASKDDGERGDVDHKIKTVAQRNALAKEKIGRLVEQHASKLQVASAALADTQAAARAVEQERSAHSHTMDENERARSELRDKLHRGKLVHEAEVASVQQQQQLLAAQVRAYHQDLQAAMKLVSTQNAVLVG